MELVAGYLGQTAMKTAEVCDKATGGVLFIDEAYSLAPEGDGGSGATMALSANRRNLDGDREFENLKTKLLGLQALPKEPMP